MGYTVANLSKRVPGDSMNTRRSFFQDAALLSALAALAEEQGYAQTQPKDPKLANFWDAYFDEAERDPNQVSRGTTDTSLIDPSQESTNNSCHRLRLDLPGRHRRYPTAGRVRRSGHDKPRSFPSVAGRQKIGQQEQGCSDPPGLHSDETHHEFDRADGLGRTGSLVSREDHLQASKVSDLNANPVIDPKTGKQKIAIKTIPDRARLS